MRCTSKWKWFIPVWVYNIEFFAFGLIAHRNFLVKIFPLPTSIGCLFGQQKNRRFLGTTLYVHSLFACFKA
jgi:hypothetical protein